MRLSSHPMTATKQNINEMRRPGTDDYRTYFRRYSSSSGAKPNAIAVLQVLKYIRSLSDSQYTPSSGANSSELNIFSKYNRSKRKVGPRCPRMHHSLIYSRIMSLLTLLLGSAHRIPYSARELSCFVLVLSSYLLLR